MESQILERIRSLEADIERHREEIVLEQMMPCTHFRHQLVRDHYIWSRIEAMRKKAAQLAELHADGELDDLRAEVEQAPLSAAVESIRKRVAELRDYHQTHRDAGHPVEADEFDDVGVVAQHVDALFTSVEGHGRHLDLQHSYKQFRELLDIENKRRKLNGFDPLVVMDLKDFAKKIGDTFSVKVLPLTAKMEQLSRYRAYVSELRKYLVDFHSRRSPLAGPLREATLKEAEAHVRERWARGFRNWDDERRHELGGAMELAIWERQIEMLLDTVLPEVVTATRESLSRRENRNAEELLRAEEEDEQAFRESLAHSSVARKRKLRRNIANIVGSGSGAAGTATATADDYEVESLLQPNAPNHTGASDPRMAAAAAAAPETSHTYTDGVAGALLTDDGTPMPYYLVQLHQLLKVFTCQICGGEQFHGPQAFHKHFPAERHTDGLRSIGIANSQLYDGVGEIRGALEIHDFEKQSFVMKRLREDVEEEEMEDAHGFVITRRRMEESGRGGLH